MIREPKWIHFLSRIHKRQLENRLHTASVFVPIWASMFVRFWFRFGNHVGVVLAAKIGEKRPRRCPGGVLGWQKSHFKRVPFQAPSRLPIFRNIGWICGGFCVRYLGSFGNKFDAFLIHKIRSLWRVWDPFNMGRARRETERMSGM